MVPLILYCSNQIKLTLDLVTQPFKLLITKVQLLILQILQIAQTLQTLQITQTLKAQPPILQTQQPYPQIVQTHQLQQLQIVA